MKTIKIPEPVDIEVEGQTVTWPMFKFVEEVCNQHAAFGKSPKGIRQGLKIITIFEQAMEAETASMEDADYKELNSAIQSSVSFNPRFARKFLPFYEAIENADNQEKT